MRNNDQENYIVHDRINEIYDLLKQVKTLPDRNLYEYSNQKEIKKLICSKGFAFVEDLDNNPEYTLEKTYFSKGTEIDWHMHKVIEILIILSGEMTIYINGNKNEIINLKTGDICKLDPYVKHFAIINDECEIYAIKIPPEEDGTSIGE